MERSKPTVVDTNNGLLPKGLCRIFSFLIITMSCIYVCMHVRVTTNNNNYGNIVSNLLLMCMACVCVACMVSYRFSFLVPVPTSCSGDFLVVVTTKLSQLCSVDSATPPIQQTPHQAPRLHAGVGNYGVDDDAEVVGSNCPTRFRTKLAIISVTCWVVKSIRSPSTAILRSNLRSFLDMLAQLSSVT